MKSKNIINCCFAIFLLSSLYSCSKSKGDKAHKYIKLSSSENVSVFLDTETEDVYSVRLYGYKPVIYKTNLSQSQK